MKTSFAWLLLLWFALVLEQARADLFSSHSLLMPFAVGCLFWLRNGVGSLLAGTALIVHWLLHPVLAPVEGAVLLLTATVFLANNTQQATWSPTASRRSVNAWWIQPIFVLVVGLAFHSLLAAELHVPIAADEFLKRLMIALPLLGLMLFGLRAADEFGWRKTSEM